MGGGKGEPGRFLWTKAQSCVIINRYSMGYLCEDPFSEARKRTDMRVELLGVGFDDLTMEEAVERGCELLLDGGTHYVVTPNPEIVECCRKDPEAMAAVNGADLVLADGVGVLYGARLRGKAMKGRVPGIEFGTEMLDRCARLRKSVFLLGAKPGVAERAARNMAERFPGLLIAGTADGYFRDDAAAAERVRASGADMVFVCLGAPKQEKFMRRWAPATGARLLLGLGGSLDVFAGVTERAPQFYRDHGLEWFYRLVKDPRRIGRMVKLPLFLLHVAGEKR